MTRNAGITQCDICREDLKPQAISPYCKRCRGGMAYAKKKGLPWQIHRRGRLTIFVARIDEVADRKVTHIHSRRKAGAR